MSEELPEESDRVEGAPHPRETAALFGQGAAEAAFRVAIGAGRPHHAWLITGPRGVGKATLAWRLARRMLAGGDPATPMVGPGDPLFRRTAALAEPRLFLARRPLDEKTGRLRTAVPVEEIRALRQFFHLSATEAGWRVAIIDAADELSDAAANALLKTLEEPPVRGMLFLVCHRPAALAPTIRSRCRTLRCAALGADDLARALEGAGAEVPQDPAALAALAGGSVGEALRLAAADGIGLYGKIAGLIAGAPGMDRRGAAALAEACAGRAQAARYDATLGLVSVALARLARAGAGAAVDPLDAAEAEALDRLAATPAQGRLWAELSSRLALRNGRARAVHIDPAQVILDTFLQIDATAAEARAFAA